MIVLDTHVLVWLINEPVKLSTKTEKTINKSIKEDNKLFVSSISVWEIFLLFKKGSLRADMDVDAWLAKVEDLSFIEFVPVNNAIGAKSVMLPEPFHKDPADRIIVATARELGTTLVTSDSKLRKYPHVKTLW